MSERTELDHAMDRYARGDDAAFRAVFQALAPRLGAFLRRLSGSRALGEDLTQEAFLRLHRARGTFGAGASALPWAYAIARNCFIDHTRARKVRPEVLAPADPDALAEPSAGPEASAEAHSIARQTAHIVERELARMTEARREAFVLLRYEGLSVADAAKILGTNENAVKLRAFHAYQALRAALDREAT